MCLYLYIYLYVIYCYFVQVGSKCSSVSDVLFLARICFCLCLVIISLFCTCLVQGWCSEWCCVCVWATRKEWREAPWGRPRIHRLDHVFIILRLIIQLELSQRGTLGATTDTSGQLDRVFIFNSIMLSLIHTSYLSRKPREFSCKFFLALIPT